VVKPCCVTFIALDGIKHTVELEAESVYEAAVFALQALKKAQFVDTPPDLGSRFRITVTEAPVTHEVSLVQVRDWVNRSAGSPAEVRRCRRLREILESALPQSSRSG
jgi:hypothetical protein